jgi:hypothetical protein
MVSAHLFKMNRFDVILANGISLIRGMLKKTRHLTPLNTSAPRRNVPQARPKRANKIPSLLVYVVL